MLLPLVVLVASIVVPSALAGTDFGSPSTGAVEGAQQHDALEGIRSYAATLNEYSNRRRSVVHVPNRQAIVRGVQVGLVNVGDGNATFQRRDLITAGVLPIMMVRVYDSSAIDSGDFGPGWRLSLAETITIRGDDAIVMRDESGSQTRYVKEAGQWVPALPRPTDIVSVALREDHAVIDLRSGIRKSYRLLKGAYRLTQVEDRNGNRLQLLYDDGRLRRIEATNGRFVTIQRDSRRISSLSDDQDRTVFYRYDGQGRLQSVIDLGGNPWSYGYDDHDRLTEAWDPLGYVDLAIEYDRRGRAVQSTMRGRTTTYDFNGRTTYVTDSNGRRHKYTQNEQGITVAVESGAGVSTRLILDEQNRVASLLRNETLVAEFFYQGDSQLVQLNRHAQQPGSTLVYNYDRNGTLLDIHDGQRFVLQLRYDRRGNVRSARIADARTRYRYHRNGALAELERSSGQRFEFRTDRDGQIERIEDSWHGTTQLEYDNVGLLEKIQFPDLSTIRFGYERVGLRKFQQPSFAKLNRFHYSASGNLYAIDHVSSAGEIITEHYELDESNKLKSVITGGFSEQRIVYNGNGDPVQRRQLSRTETFHYDEQNRLTTVVAGDTILTYSYDDGEPDIRVQMDDLTDVNLTPHADTGLSIGSMYELLLNRTRITPYRTVVFDPSLTEFRLVSPLGVVLPHEPIEESLTRSRLLTLGDGEFHRKAHFSMPSNVVFIPREYDSVNCATPPPEHCDGPGPGIDASMHPSPLPESIFGGRGRGRSARCLRTITATAAAENRDSLLPL